MSEATDEPAEMARNSQAGLVRRLIVYAGLAAMAAILTIQAQSSFRILWSSSALRAMSWHRFSTRVLPVPGTGLDPLPKQVPAAVSLLEHNNASTFRLSPGLVADDLLRQRIDEVAWPRAFDPASPFVLRRESEPALCAPLAAMEGMALDRCN